MKVKDNDEVGYLYILEGELISAESGDLKNREAFNRIISWENVAIEIENTCTKTENEINQPLMNLLMEGLRVKDEKEVKESLEPTSGELIEDEQIDFIKEMEEEVSLSAENEAQPITETNIDSATTSETDVFDKIDEDIEKRIAAFEDDLSMECPMCKNAKIMSEETSTGKLYYKCSNKTCIFISWGKPHHIVCPKCNNPFLTEVSGKGGRPILKCPRATCRHWQKLSRKQTDDHQERVNSGSQTDNGVAAVSRKPRRKVVRKRRVRRKK